MKMYTGSFPGKPFYTSTFGQHFLSFSLYFLVFIRNLANECLIDTIYYSAKTLI